MKTIIYTLVSMFLTSCMTNYTINVNKDGSAHVIISEMKEVDGEVIEAGASDSFFREMDNFKNSNQISNYKREKKDGYTVIEYDLKNIDSLEYYLLPLSIISIDSISHLAEFRYTKDKFTITKNYKKNSQEEIDLLSKSIPYTVEFNFKKKIKEFKSDVDFVKQTGKKTIEINSYYNQISNGSGTKKIEVLFK